MDGARLKDGHCLETKSKKTPLDHDIPDILECLASHQFPRSKRSTSYKTSSIWDRKRENIRLQLGKLNLAESMELIPKFQVVIVHSQSIVSWRSIALSGSGVIKDARMESYFLEYYVTQKDNIRKILKNQSQSTLGGTLHSKQPNHDDVV